MASSFFVGADQERGAIWPFSTEQLAEAVAWLWPGSGVAGRAGPGNYANCTFMPMGWTCPSSGMPKTRSLPILTRIRSASLHGSCTGCHGYWLPTSLSSGGPQYLLTERRSVQRRM